VSFPTVLPVSLLIAAAALLWIVRGWKAPARRALRPTPDRLAWDALRKDEERAK
jgi:hypothetical protein